MANKSEKTRERLLEEIKKLLILQLHRGGASNKEIGAILDVSYKTIERMLPKNSKKKKKNR